MSEGFVLVLVNAAVEAACAAVHKVPPPPTDLFPKLARFRGLLIGSFVNAAFILTLCGKWLDATPRAVGKLMDW